MTSRDRSAFHFAPPLLAALTALIDASIAPAQAPQWLPTNTQPRVRSRAGAANMPFSGRPVLFSGAQQVSNSGTAYQADLWEWSGSRWSRIDAPGPPPRDLGAMCLDLQRQRIVLFGGVSPTGSLLSDTWEFDGVSWTERTPTLSPWPATNCVLAYDPLRQRTVLYGMF